MKQTISLAWLLIPLNEIFFLYEIADSYARSNNTDKVNEVLNLASNNAQRLRILKNISNAYCRGGYVKKANGILQLALPAERINLLRGMMSHYAAAGDIQEAYNTLRVASNSDERYSLLQYMVWGFAENASTSLQTEFLSLASSSDERYGLLREYALAHAQSGQVDKVNKILNFIPPDSNQRNTMLRRVLTGYANSGYVDEINNLLSFIPDGANKNNLLAQIIYGYAVEGFVTAANSILSLATTPQLRNELLNGMIMGYLKSDCIEEAANCMNLFSAEDDTQKSINIIINYLKKTEVNFTYSVALQTLSLFNPNCQIIIADKLKDAKEFFFIDFRKLTSPATRINHIISSQLISYKQSLAWIKSEIQLWLMQGITLVEQGRLTPLLFLKIVSYLAPMSNSDNLKSSTTFSTLFCKNRFFANEAILMDL